jgi:hypothetical protein
MPYVIYSKWRKNILTFSISSPSKIYTNWDLGMKIYHLATIVPSHIDTFLMQNFAEVTVKYFRIFTYKKQLVYADLSGLANVQTT